MILSRKAGHIVPAVQKQWDLRNPLTREISGFRDTSGILRIGHHNAGGSGYRRNQGTGWVVCNVSRANENQRRHPQVSNSNVGEDWLLRQRHIVVLMVLRRRVAQPPKALARGVIAWRQSVTGRRDFASTYCVNGLRHQTVAA